MAENIDLITLKDVHFYWTKLATPTLLKDAKDRGVQFNPNDPLANTEWTIQAVVPRKTFKALKTKFPTCSNFPHAKEFDLDEPVFADSHHQGNQESVPDFGEKEVVSIKFSQRCRTKAGKDQKRPTLIGIKGRVQDINGVSVDADTLIGNGSKGHIQLRPVDFGANGVYLYPNAICVVELVEYSGGGGGGVDESAFGIEELDEADISKESVDESYDDAIPF